MGKILGNVSGANINTMRYLTKYFMNISKMRSYLSEIKYKLNNHRPCLAIEPCLRLVY